jgi:hypothetical protein
MVTSVVNLRLEPLHSAAETKHATTSHPSGPLEPPDEIPDTTNTAKHMGIPGGLLVSVNQRHWNEHHDVMEENGLPPDNEPLNVTVRTRLAYDTAWALNQSLHSSHIWTPTWTLAATRCKVSPVHNPYSSTPWIHPSLRQTTIPETFGHERQPGMPTHINTTSSANDDDRAYGGGHPPMGGSVLSPHHCNWDLWA